MQKEMNDEDDGVVDHEGRGRRLAREAATASRFAIEIVGVAWLLFAWMAGAAFGFMSALVLSSCRGWWLALLACVFFCAVRSEASVTIHAPTDGSEFTLYFGSGISLLNDGYGDVSEGYADNVWTAQYSGGSWTVQPSFHATDPVPSGVSSSGSELILPAGFTPAVWQTYLPGGDNLQEAGDWIAGPLVNGTLPSYNTNLSAIYSDLLQDFPLPPPYWEPTNSASGDVLTLSNSMGVAGDAGLHVAYIFCGIGLAVMALQGGYRMFKRKME